MNNHPITIVIFGASGDLTQRKLIPALFNLYQKERLPETRIIGTSRSKFSHDQFKQNLLKGVKKYSPDSFQQDKWDNFSKNIYYQPGNLADPEDFCKLGDILNALEDKPSNRLYYLAISPDFYHQTIKNMGKAGLASQEGIKSAPWKHVIVEKPFGKDLQTAQELNKIIHQVFSEDQVYRIDHYLGKETAQNILFFRFANTIFEPI